MFISYIFFPFTVFLAQADDDRNRRALGMLRMGKRGSAGSDMSFLRMGRSYSLPPLVPPSYELPDDLEDREASWTFIFDFGC